ncbi:MAG: NYN domain-containing protein [Methylocystaceae bacterium]
MPAKKETVLIVDGYNVIYAWPELMQLKDKSLQASREALIDIMINYAAYKGYRVYVVFDGQGTEDTVEYNGSIYTCYTREGDTADQYIERLVGDEAFTACEVYVATSDYAQQRIVLGRGAHRISSRELHIQVQKMWDKFDRLQEKTGSWSGMLVSRLGAEMRTALEKLRRSK